MDSRFKNFGTPGYGTTVIVDEKTSCAAFVPRCILQGVGLGLFFSHVAVCHSCYTQRLSLSFLKTINSFLSYKQRQFTQAFLPFQAIMTHRQPSPDVSQSYYEHRTLVPDILSAPAPVLRDHDILIDGEPVTWEDQHRSSSTSFARPSPVNTSSTQTYYHHQQQHPSSSTSTTSPAMSSLTTSPTSVSPPAATQPSLSFARPPPNQPMYQASTYDPYSPRESQIHHPNNRNNSRSEYPPPSRAHSSPAIRNYHQSGVVLHQTREIPGSTRPPAVEKMRQRRKVATAAAGVVGGIAGLAVLGPVGALAGGVGGAMLCKHTGKRMERKQTERIAAARHAAEEQRYGRMVPALQADSALT